MCVLTSAQVRLANDCDFGLGSYAFSGSQARASAIGSQIQAGMFVVNDYASNAMCQSLPFGGVKESGFDRCAASMLPCLPAIGSVPCRVTMPNYVGNKSYNPGWLSCLTINSWFCHSEKLRLPWPQSLE